MAPPGCLYLYWQLEAQEACPNYSPHRGGSGF